jgi:hypothetical protein
MNEDATVPIPRPTCGEKTEKSLGWLKTNDHFTCGCGTVVRVNGEEFVRQIESAIDDLKRKIQSSFK